MPAKVVTQFQIIRQETRPDDFGSAPNRSRSATTLAMKLHAARPPPRAQRHPDPSPQNQRRQQRRTVRPPGRGERAGDKTPPPPDLVPTRWWSWRFRMDTQPRNARTATTLAIVVRRFCRGPAGAFIRREAVGLRRIRPSSAEPPPCCAAPSFRTAQPATQRTRKTGPHRPRPQTARLRAGDPPIAAPRPARGARPSSRAR